jgi:anti-sigma B factor antagonist
VHAARVHQQLAPPPAASPNVSTNPGTSLAQRKPRSLRFHSSGGAMSFQTSKENDVVVVDVDGQLIVGNRQELKQKVLDELEGGERKFLIDFTNTGYIDSSGLGVLVSLSKKIREQNGELRLSNLNEDLRTLFELTKLDTLFSIADSRDEALASF